MKVVDDLHEDLDILGMFEGLSREQAVELSKRLCMVADESDKELEDKVKAVYQKFRSEIICCDGGMESNENKNSS